MGLLSIWHRLTSGTKPLEVGSAMPATIVADQDGNLVNLESFSGKEWVLVYFYPKADTPGCTAQACSVRDGFTELTQKGVVVFGVSADTVEAQKRFLEKYHLPFTLLADVDRHVIHAFGVPTLPLVKLASRQAFLFHKGKLVWRDLSASTKAQADDVLRVLH